MFEKDEMVLFGKDGHIEVWRIGSVYYQYTEFGWKKFHARRITDSDPWGKEGLSKMRNEKMLTVCDVGTMPHSIEAVWPIAIDTSGSMSHKPKVKEINVVYDSADKDVALKWLMKNASSEKNGRFIVIVGVDYDGCSKGLKEVLETVRKSGINVVSIRID